MWHIEYTATTDLEPHAVWKALQALESGTSPMRSGDGRALNGTFALHETISSTPAGLGTTLQSTITELVEDRVLAVTTNFNGLDLLLRHTLQQSPDGGTRITRRLEISGEQADEQAPVAGPRISEDYPEALEEIITVARSGAQPTQS